VREKKVPLGRVSLRDRRFSFSRGGSVDTLVHSVREAGLFTPPDLLFEKGRYTIIRGFRRIRALHRLGRGEFVARVFLPEEITPLEAWSLNFFDTLSSRPLNPAEACTALRQLTDLGVPREEILKKYLPLLGLPHGGENLDSFLAVAALPEKILDALADGAVTFPSAFFLAGLDGREQRAAFRFLVKAGLTVSQQREWARLAGDICARDGLPVATVLSSASRSASRRGGRFGETVLQVLRERRFPALAARRKAFQELLRRLKLPSQIQITTHPTFEKGGITVRFTAQSPQAYTRILSLLQRLHKEGALPGLIDPGREEEGP
jgi:ParB-like chromosome segregation protein Spo0J